MDARIGNIERDVGAIKADVAKLLERDAKTQGSKSALWTVGGSSATAGGLIVAVLQWWGSLQPGQPQHRAEREPVAPAFSQPMHSPVDNSRD